MSEPKPLHWSFFVTFTIVLATIWLTVMLFAHSQRARLLEELAVVVATGTEDEAVAALRQMAQMPEPPLETFAVAAISPSRPVACQAQESIGELLRKWRIQAKKPINLARVAARLERLAALLHAERDSICELDYRWLTRTTERVLRLANSAPPEDPLNLAVHCESLLAITTLRQPKEIRIVPVATNVLEVAPNAIFDSPSRLALESIVVEPETTSSLSTQVDAHPPRRFAAVGDTPRKVASAIPVEEEVEPESTTPDLWSEIDSRALLNRWLMVGGSAQQPIERELQRRGFGELRSDVVRLALEGGTPSRVQLVHDLASLPGVGAKAWLMLLADDQDADVRLAAVTMMTISKDHDLLEKAWQVALHDHDPRIAGLVEKLRDKR